MASVLERHGDARTGTASFPNGVLAERPVAPNSASAMAVPRSAVEPRFSDRPPSVTSRIAGAMVTLAICLSIAGIGMLRHADGHTPRTAPAALTLVEVAAPRAPPTPPSEKPPGPQLAAERVPAAPAPPIALHPSPTPQASVQPSLPLPAHVARRTGTPAAMEQAPEPAASPPAARASAPESRAVPPAEKASDTRPEWEGMLLAALNRAKRYPREASRERQQGVVRIVFLVDRRGRVHSVRLVRSSGFAALDAEALSLPLRAQPLPRPPAGLRSSRVELTVPIEFFLR